MQVSHAVEKSEYYASFACCRIKRVLCEFRKTSRKASSGMKNTDVGLCRFFLRQYRDSADSLYGAIRLTVEYGEYEFDCCFAQTVKILPHTH